MKALELTPLGRAGFFKRAGISIAIFVGPLILGVLSLLNGVHDQSAIAFSYLVFFGGIFVLALLALVLLFLAFRRVVDTGLPVIAGAALPLAVGTSFLDISSSNPALVAAALIPVLALKTGALAEPRPDRLYWPVAAVTTLSLICLACSVATWLGIYRLSHAATMIAYPLLGAVIWTTSQANAPKREDEPVGRVDPITGFLSSAFAGTPWIALGLAVTLVAFTLKIVVTGRGFHPAFLLGVPTILPTTFVWLLAIAPLYQLLVARRAAAAVFLVLGLVPMAHWSYQATDGARGAMPVVTYGTATPGISPDILVLEARQNDYENLFELTGVDRILIKNSNTQDYTVLDKNRDTSLRAPVLPLAEGVAGRTAMVIRQFQREDGRHQYDALVRQADGSESLVVSQHMRVRYPRLMVLPFADRIGWEGGMRAGNREINYFDDTLARAFAGRTQ